MTSHKNNNSASCENESINNFKLSNKSVELRKKCQILIDMHCERLTNPPRHAMGKYLIAMHLSI